VESFSPAAAVVPAERGTDTPDCDMGMYTLWWTCTCFGTSH
jgi:hypothetical protein